MDKIIKEFKEAKKKIIIPFITFLILLYILYYSYIQVSYVAAGVGVLGLIFVGYELYSSINFNSYLKSQLLLVKKNPEQVMKNLNELVNEMKEANREFESSSQFHDNYQSRELLEEKKYKKRKHRKEVYDIVFAIKNYIKKENNIK